MRDLKSPQLLQCIDDGTAPCSSDEKKDSSESVQKPQSQNEVNSLVTGMEPMTPSLNMALQNQFIRIHAAVKDIVDNYPGGCPEDMTFDIEFGGLFVPMANVTIGCSDIPKETVAMQNFVKALGQQLGSNATVSVVKKNERES